MAFCINCGRELAEGAKFCANCGKAINGNNSTTQRKTIFDGEIHKCPNCGEILNSFTANCPACGHEIRNSTATSAVTEFARKLELLNKGRTIEKKGFASSSAHSIVDEQMISMIRNFPIPNTKEDLLEFIILAASNINEHRYDMFENISGSQKAVSDAWHAKLDQAYQKIRLSFGDAPEIRIVQEILEEKNNKIQKNKVSGSMKFLITFIGVWVLWGLVFIFISNYTN